MATGDYCTIEQLREELLRRHSYTATTISFDSATKKILDSANGLRRFQSPPDGTTGRTVSIKVTGSPLNSKTFTIVTGDNPAFIVVTESVSSEVAGASITISDVSHLDDDTMLALAISSASRSIDNDADRFFYKRGASGSEETRYFDARDRDTIYIDDCVSILSLATDDNGDRTYSTVWATTDYELEPSNATLQVEPEPYIAVSRKPLGRYYFPADVYPPYMYSTYESVAASHGGKKSVKIVGVWGWSAVPTDIQKACIIQAARYFKRGDSIFGMFGDTSVGGSPRPIPKLDPDVAAIIGNRRKYALG